MAEREPVVQSVPWGTRKACGCLVDNELGSKFRCEKHGGKQAEQLFEDAEEGQQLELFEEINE